jgi:deoxyribonuclease-4
MPIFGAHLSIAGGYHKALEAAQGLDCGTVQLFLSSPRIWPVTPIATVSGNGKRLTNSSNGWSAKPLTDQEIAIFRSALGNTRLRHPTGHDSYLINLGSPDEGLWQKSLEAFIVEVQRADALGLDYLVTHPGSPTDGNEKAGLKRVAKALDQVHKRCAGVRVKVLLETTAGQGNCLGHRFEHLARLLELVKQPERLGVCLDTCHVFAAGYALAPEPEYLTTMREFDSVVGLRQLRVFHLNDSQKPQGSRVDRHAHLGRGCLGLEPFRLLVNDPRFQDLPMILETPKEDGDNGDMDSVNLQVLRDLLH